MDMLLKQITEKAFKTSNFTVYNMIEDGGFVSELEGMYDIKYGVDDFEYLILDLSIKEKNALLYRMSSVIGKFDDLKILIEKDLQDNKLKPKARLYINKDKGFVFVVKLKEFDLVDRINKMKIGDEQECSSPMEVKDINL